MVANLKKLRTEHGYSQERLASMINVSQQAIYKYENLSVEPDIQTLIQLADIFGVSVDHLIGRTDRLAVMVDGRAVISISSDEADHIRLWRTLPLSLRYELDKLFKKYEVRPYKK